MKIFYSIGIRWEQWIYALGYTGAYPITKCITYAANWTFWWYFPKTCSAELRVPSFPLAFSLLLFFLLFSQKGRTSHCTESTTFQFVALIRILPWVFVVAFPLHFSQNLALDKLWHMCILFFSLYCVNYYFLVIGAYSVSFFFWNRELLAILLHVLPRLFGLH